MQISFTNKSTLVNNFPLQDQSPKNLTSGAVYKFHSGLYNEFFYGECVRFLNVRIIKHIGISPHTQKQVKPKNSSLANLLLFCNHSASYDDFSILAHESNTFLLELKDRLLIMRDKPSLYRNITSVPLCLLHRP